MDMIHNATLIDAPGHCIGTDASGDRLYLVPDGWRPVEPYWLDAEGYAHEGSAEGPELGVEVGPALGMRFREGVRLHATQNRSHFGWDRIVSLPNGQLAEVIGAATTLDEAVELAAMAAVSLDPSRGNRASL